MSRLIFFRNLFVVITVFLAPTVSAEPLDPMDFVPLGDFNPAEDVFIDTSSLAMTGGASETGVVHDGVAVFVFEDFVLPEGITVHTTGTLPLALLAQNTMTIAGTIDVSASFSTAGPGGYYGGNPTYPFYSRPFPTGFGSGGGADSSGGGFGGRGGGGCHPGGGETYGNLDTQLEGGSGGGGGQFLPGGGGGGALELGVVQGIILKSTSRLLADGSSGAGLSFSNAGSGGGAGGGILVHGTSLAPVVIERHAVVSANGGSGGTSSAGGTGGGGGGRIRILYIDSIEGSLLVEGGAGYSTWECPGYPGQEGSIRISLANSKAAGFVLY